MFILSTKFNLLSFQKQIKANLLARKEFLKQHPEIVLNADKSDKATEVNMKENKLLLNDGKTYKKVINIA